MTMRQRLFWGFLAGLAIVLVKIVGPERAYVRSLFDPSSSVDMIFYVFISVVTIALGVVSGLFSKESEPVKLLLFCASVPALLTTYTAAPREALPSQIHANVVQSSPAAIVDVSTFGLFSPSIFISLAQAQSSAGEHECKEASFAEKFVRSAEQYLGGKKSDEQPYFGVVVASTENFEEAKAIATSIFEEDKKWAPFVGCRKPGNAFYPIIVGAASTKFDAAQLQGEFEQANLRSDKPYLSFYKYRTAIFTPH